MGGGADYQARVSAWVAAHMLAEEDVEPPFGLNAPVASIACEASEPVDDLIVSTDAGCTAYVQAKRNVSLSKARCHSGRLAPLASAVDQFVRQFVLGRTSSEGVEDLADTTHDRFVLAVGSGAPQTIRVTLREALEHVRVYSGHDLAGDGLSKESKRALNIVVEHVRASWREETGFDPEDHDIRALLSLVHVMTIDVGKNERDEQVAKSILRWSVLKSPDQAGAAWSVLISESLHLIRTRGHADRASLLEVLHSANLTVRASRSYRDDIQRLRDHSDRVTRSLAEHASIQLEGSDLWIQRPYVSLLKETADARSVLVVGEPGVGKSGVLHSLVEALHEDERDVIVLTPQQLPILSPDGLRNELRLEHDPIDVLANWPGTRTAFLIIDALDAARTEPATAALRNLIREVGQYGHRWNVVASIREYDARYSRKWADIFKGTPPEGPVSALADEPFARMCHIVVGRLTDNELQQISELGAPELAWFLESASAAVAELLHTPFNLRLAAELLDRGTNPQAIQDVRTQLDLLDLYWQERVLGDDKRSREIVLRQVVKVMSRKRVLHVDRDLVETGVVEGLHISELLSEQVLIEWKPRPDAPPRRSTLAFAHHVLFDFAVAQLLLRRDATRVATFLAEDPAFVLLGRPSLVMHFHYLWGLDYPGSTRDWFWKTVLAVCGQADIPEIGKLIGPSVAAEIGVEIWEFEPLLKALGNADDSVRASGENALEYCVRALRKERGSQPEAASLFCDLAERLSNSFTSRSSYPTSWLLADLVARLDQLSSVQAERVGTISRCLLTFAWTLSVRHYRLVTRAIQFVCQTLATDITLSSDLLRRAIEPNHFALHGSEELRVLADKVPSITPYNPGLVKDIYRIAFEYEETSDAPTHFGGVVLTLTSNRRQDYQAGLFQLVQAYPEFLRIAPQVAVEVMNVALERQISQAGSLLNREAIEFDLDGEPVLLQADGSHTWDKGQGHPREDAVHLLDHVQSRLEELAEEEENTAELANLLDILTHTCRLAVVWRRLLNLGTRYPSQIGMRIRAAGWSPAVLTCPDTIRDVGRMNGALYLNLSEVDREKIECTILSIPVVAPSTHRIWAEQTRDRLLGCLPEAGLVTTDALELLSVMHATCSVPRNEDNVTPRWSRRKFDEIEFLADHGVPVDKEENKRLHDLGRKVREFVTACQNRVPEQHELVEVFPHLQGLYTALRSAEADRVHEFQRDSSWGELAEGCVAIASMENLHHHEEAVSFVRTVLLEASRNRLPYGSRDEDARFVEPGWGKPAARVDAAAGLITILRHPSCEDTDILTAVEQLGVDPAPSVRWQIAHRLTIRYDRDPDWTWTMIKRMSRDRSPGVLRALVDGPLRSLSFNEPERVAKITIGIRQAAADAPNLEKLVNSCATILIELFIWGKDESASAVIDSLADDLISHPEEVAYLASQFRDLLVVGTIDPPDLEADVARQRSWSFLLRVTRGVAVEFQRRVEREGDTHSLAKEGPTEQLMRVYVRTLDAIGRNIYFASGANDDDESPGKQVLRRFYTESGPVIDELADVGLPSLTHNLLQVLETLVFADPRGVFLRIARVVRGGEKGGYQYDPMAEEVLVRIVDGYLADHRELFQVDEEAQQHLIEVLDTFVHAGSEGARRLSYELDGIFR